MVLVAQLWLYAYTKFQWRGVRGGVGGGNTKSKWDGKISPKQDIKIVSRSQDKLPAVTMDKFVGLGLKLLNSR